MEHDKLVKSLIEFISVCLRHHKTKLVADAVGLAPSTVRKYQRQEVRYPRAQTLFALLNWAGYELVLGPKQHR